jgi:Kdo2-lipid IVA lauroyltransferase/acyltransferase
MPAVAERASTETLSRPRAARRARRRPPWRDRVEFLFLRGFMGALAALPLPAAFRIAEALAFLVYLLDRPHRRIGMINLGLAFPEKPIRERRRILRESFLNLGRMAAELAHIPRTPAAVIHDRVRFADEAWWSEAIGWERPSGVLILSGHFGNWELLVYAHGLRGHPVHMVHRAIANPLVDRWLNDLRRGAGTKLIRKRTAARDVLQALRQKELLVLPFDQNSVRGMGIFVDFFGVPASTNAGLCRIAMRAEAPIAPAFIVRDGRTARHTVHVLPVIYPTRGDDLEADVLALTKQCSAIFEDMVRRYPEQWLWMHKRWKTRPPGEPKIY